MPRFSANLSMLFPEVPLVERIERARAAGFAAVEMQFPYEVPAGELARALDDARLPLVLINVPAGDLLAGGDGLACVPGREDDLARAVEQALEYTSALRVPMVNVLAGRLPRGGSRDECLTVLDANLRALVPRFEGRGVRVLLEPLNAFDVPDFLVPTPEDVLAVLDRARVPALLQYDVYHATRMGSDIIADLRRYAARIGHVQFADVPGRGAPGTGGIDFGSVFTLLDALGYRGYAGAEYRPEGPTEPTLGYLARYQR